MKASLIFFIILAVTTAYHQNDKKAIKKYFNKWITECAKEVSTVQLGKSTRKTRGFIEELHDDSLVCMLACSLRKMANKQGKTLHKVVLDLVDDAYHTGFDRTEFTRKDVESRIDHCFAQEREECEKFACTHPSNSSLADILYHEFSIFAGTYAGDVIREMLVSDED